ncbi:malto-oligosyltrehalose trehalohydrolase [Novosphingobium sp. Rr 2-17]|uniref:malto-oligosyltrehalose trehalohydrolase n=1 Tax=Novosphingobium sp. Rr 2-17 TaxID=555793 RepID=UPI000269A20B|nr:malto-oligosyltrehalose trehalohydrolase [Novosphingobium sp. Rr 2-17]EIZ78483.1 malto-oligosyltrehalose trehalohydrolase [Novosphingobium sp. Rr 2-17]
MQGHYRKAWGADPLDGGGWRFRLWAPDACGVGVELGPRAVAMQRGSDGWWWGVDIDATTGEAYRFAIDGGHYPDPASRQQEGDVHGPSLLVDPRDFAWRHDWRGVPWHDAVVYELHVGTFTDEGTFAAAAQALPRLADLGVTMVELMPVAQFDGARGWGYDGVLPYAPHPAYGTPDDMRAFVDAAHGLGIGVLLDVVYNHLGPSGNYLPAWCKGFMHPDRASPWGEGIAYEERAVRDYFVDNALFWLTEYRLDGLRLDAVHAIDDRSRLHLLDELGQRVRAFDWGRPIHLVTEDDRNLVRYFEPEAPFTATWNDDWHHAVHCLLTGEDESYYASFARDPLADIEMALRDGYVVQGQPREGDPHQRGEPSTQLPRTVFVNFLGNHDQVGNRAQGERLHHLVSDRTAYRVVTALTLLAPFTPMLFMGDEFFTDAPFQFFVDFQGDLADAVRKGRAAEFAQFRSFGGPVPDPTAPETFAASKIGQPERDEQQAHAAFVRDLLALRRAHVVPLLAANALPVAEVTRDGALIEATWRFGSKRLLLRCLLGEGTFAPHPDPLVVIRGDDSAFAFSAAVESE